MWTKGKSGNPGGRPKIAKAWEAATGKRVSEITAEALKLVWDRAVQGPQPNHFGDPNDPDWRFAMQKVLEYSVGKPKETLEITGDGAPQRAPIDWDAMPVDEKRTLLAALDRVGALSESSADDTEH